MMPMIHALPFPDPAHCAASAHGGNKNHDVPLPIDYRLVVIGLSLFFLASALSHWDSLRESHRKSELLKAYRLRYKWRKADIPKLRELGVGKVAEPRINRIQAAGGGGRGVIRRFQSLDETLAGSIDRIATALFCPEAQRAARVRLLRRTPLWNNFAEAFYRAEYAEAKRAGLRSPFEEAERSVANRLGISTAVVRRACTQIRRERRVPNRPMSEEAVISRTEVETWLAGGIDLKTFWPAGSESPGSLE
jgi:hypothetical protein